MGMEHNGLPISLEVTQAIKEKARSDLELTEAELAEWSRKVDYVGPEMPPNWGSAQQLTLFLHTELGLKLPPSPYWGKGKVDLENGEVKTDNRALTYIASQNLEYKPLIDLIKTYRWQNRVIKYCEKWEGLAVYHDDWYFLHPSFGLASDFDNRPGAVTGRFAIKNPPLQQIPSHDDDYGLKRAFQAPPGYSVVEVDFSQLEVVILAHICHRLFGATSLLDKMAPGRDIHTETAKFVFGDILGYPEAISTALENFRKNPTTAAFRDLIKAIRYGLNYGKGSYGFGNTLFNADGTCLGEVRAQELIDALFKLDPEILDYQSYVREYITKNEGIVSLCGKWCPLPTARSRKEWERNRAWRRALNYPMQAGGQEIAALSMISAWFCEKLRKLRFKLCLQIHDSLVGYVPTKNAEEASNLVGEHMRNSIKLDCYLGAKGGYGPSLGEAK